MKVKLCFVLITVLLAVSSYAQDDTRIMWLIDATKNMPEGTVFIRNGTEHTPKEAADHLLSKYNRVKKKITTAELFIEQLASKSSISGKPYTIKFKDGTVVTAEEFLTKTLAKYNQ